MVFLGEGCPYCARELAFLADLAATRPGLVVQAYEVWSDETNRALVERTAAAAGVEVRAVPTTFLDGRVWVGFDDVIADQITAAIDAALAGDPSIGPSGPAEAERTTVVVPVVGRVDLGDRSLVVSTLAAVMLLRPELMESVVGALATFAAAAAVSAFGLAIMAHRLRPEPIDPQ